MAAINKVRRWVQADQKRIKRRFLAAVPKLSKGIQRGMNQAPGAFLAYPKPAQVGLNAAFRIPS